MLPSSGTNRQYPEGFVLVVDTREQTPLFLKKPPKGLVIVRDTLKHGDYSLRGFEDVICIERKRAQEVYSWLGKERIDTVKKLLAMKMYWKGLVIEGTEDMLYEANKTPLKRGVKYNPDAVVEDEKFRSQVTPTMVRRALASFRVRYNLHVYYAPGRKAAEQYILDVFELFYIRLREGKIKI